ncbi:MAG: 3-phosphoglycerate dehydrogenase [Candidatus Sungbacteria bacterium]|nr:3-phosphoglycerate dehydrogenase [Candidatus Sungbacteria bacterium]
MPIILATTHSFVRAVENLNLKSDIEARGFFYREVAILASPFSFDPADVVAIAAGEPKLGASELSHFPNLKIIARFGRGLDNIDIACAQSRGIAVTSVPHGSNKAVAELAVGFMFSMARKIPEFDRQIKRGEWRRDYSRGVVGKKLGIVGFGAIGKEVAAMARGIGMQVSAFDPHASLDEFRRAEVLQNDFNMLMQESDFVSLHVPLTDATKHLMNSAAIAFMKKDAFLINTSRGGVVDEKALLDALNEEKIAGAALDVFAKEPPFREDGISKLLALHPKVIATPHAASFTQEAHEEIARVVLENIFAACGAS